MKLSEPIVSEFSFPHCTKYKQYLCGKCGRWSASKAQHSCDKGFREVKSLAQGLFKVTEPISDKVVSCIITEPIQPEARSFWYVRMKLFGGVDKIAGRLVDMSTLEIMAVNIGNLVITDKDFGVYLNQDMTPALIPMATIEQLVINYELPLRRFDRFYSY